MDDVVAEARLQPEHGGEALEVEVLRVLLLALLEVGPEPLVPLVELGGVVGEDEADLSQRVRRLFLHSVRVFPVEDLHDGLGDDVSEAPLRGQRGMMRHEGGQFTILLQKIPLTFRCRSHYTHYTLKARIEESISGNNSALIVKTEEPQM